LAYGYAYYDSQLLPKHPDVAADFDPLAYLVEQGQRRGIAVHAWLVAGPLGYESGPGPTFAEHPEWAMVGPDGRQTFWLNYTRPDVRQFVGDLVIELVTNYAVDGVHFDYTRYPGSGWGYDGYTAELAATEAGLDVERLRYAELPAYGMFEGNPLAGVETARVLATFSDGQPALLENDYGAGTAVIFNWNASRREVAAESNMLARSLAYLHKEGGGTYILLSETNAARYGTTIFDQGFDWLVDLGSQPITIGEHDIATLDDRAVFVLPQVYVIDDVVAADLAVFVRRGGGAILIDGPTPSMDDRNLQAVTGMRGAGDYFREARLLLAAQEHEILAAGEPVLALEQYRVRDAQWKAFRMEGINRMLQDVYQRVKRERPAVVLSITVLDDQQRLAEEHLLDWQSWLEGEYVDLLIPRAYVNQDGTLQPVLANWQPAVQVFGRIVFGIKAFSGNGSDATPKAPDRVIGEIEMARIITGNGVVVFDLEHTSADVLKWMTQVWSLSGSNSPSQLEQ